MSVSEYHFRRKCIRRLYRYHVYIPIRNLDIRLPFHQAKDMDRSQIK